MKNKSFLSKIIIILIILVLVIMVALVMLGKNDSNQRNSNAMVNTENKTDANNVKSNKVSSYNDYFGVKNAIEKYLIFLSMKENEAVYSLLDKEYTAKNNITTENVIDKLGETTKTEVLITEMTYNADSEYNNTYYVKGYIYEYNGDEYTLDFQEKLKRDYENLSIIVKQDKYNMTFSIIPN